MAWTAEEDCTRNVTGPLQGEGTALPGETEGVLTPQKGERNALDTSSEKNGEAKLCDVAAGWTDGAASEMGTERAKGTGRRRRRREGANVVECVDGAPRRDGTPGTGRRRRRAQGEGDGQETPGAACGMAALDERLMTLNIAWTFDSYEQAEEMLNGSAGEYIADLLEPKGLTTLGFIHNGMRQLTNATRTVTTPEDLEGIKIRVPGGEPFMQAFTLMGADPLTMSFSELYTGMSQGTVDGQENGYDLIYNNSFYEVQPYITEWNYSYGAFALVFNSEIWNSLNEQTQQAIQEVADEVCATGNANVVNSEAEQRQAILDYGCEITVLTEEQIKAFQDVLVEQGYYEYFYNKYGADAFEAFGIDIESLRA